MRPVPKPSISELWDALWRRTVMWGPGPKDCWAWVGEINADGYGIFRRERAHRVFYELATGTAVPRGLVLDHLCRNRRCVRPSHLEPVTIAENVRRGSEGSKTACRRGHPYDEANTYRDPSGRRRCRECHRQESRRRYAAQRGAEAEHH